MKQIEAHRLTNNINYVKKLWETESPKFNLSSWSLYIDDMEDKIGVCDYNNKTITLSSVFMRGANCNYAKIKKALLHEIAHAITPGHSHNTVWKNVCGKIGGDTRLSATMNPPGRNWSVNCAVCKWRQEYIKKPDMNGKVCGKCKTQPKVRYIK